MSAGNRSHTNLLPQHVQDVSLDLNHTLSEAKPTLKFSSLISKWIRTILSEETTRNLFFFLLLNLSFAFVELFYGMWTNSLGLISDAFHMFFDCTALLAGLIASIVARWQENERFSYGYVRAEVIAGFVNAMFLLFVAFFIFAEAIERAFEPPQVKHERLMVVSVAGFIVNLVGIFVFQHGGSGHGHSHGGHDHSHGHNDHTHSHSHSHGTGSSQILQGIFLHILADTLGSVGVIISSLLIQNFGWMMADPVCSMFIAILIMISVYPLMKDSLSILMQRSPHSLDHTLSEGLRKIYEQDEVLQIHDPHFWTLCSGTYIGALRLEVINQSDSSRLVAMARSILSQVGVSKVTIEVTHAE